MTYKSSEKSFFESVKEKEKEVEEVGTKKALKWYDFGSSKLRAEIKRRPAQYFFLFISTFFGSVVTSSVALFIFSGNIIAQFTAPKTTAKVEAVQTTNKQAESQKYDPLLLSSKIAKQEKDYELVDIRGVSDFLSGHIKGSVNVPVYGTSLVTKSGELDPEAVKITFKNYLKTDKVLIIYAQNAYSTIPQDLVSLLSSDSKKVKALAVGWDEWKHLSKGK